MAVPRHRWLAAALCSALLPVYVWLLYSAYYELFVDEPGKHCARIQFQDGAWSVNRVELLLNTPTVGNLAMLACAAIALAGLAVLYLTAIRNSSRRWQVTGLVVQGVGLLGAVSAFLIVIEDFLSSAGNFG